MKEGQLVFGNEGRREKAGKEKVKGAEYFYLFNVKACADIDDNCVRRCEVAGDVERRG